VGTVLASIDFKVLAYTINPGLKGLFPWLSTMANSFERYRFSKLDFEYVPRRGYNTSGSVYYGIDYDVKENLPANEQQLCAFEGTVEAPPYRPFMLKSRPASLATGGTKKFTRGSDIVSGDASLYDAGNFLVGTQDFSSDEDIAGKVWVTYVVHFETPQIPSTGQPVIQPGQQTIYFQNDFNGAVGVNGGIIEPLTGAKIGLNQLQLDPVGSNGTIVVKQPGCYRLEGSAQVSAPPLPNDGTLVDTTVTCYPPDGKVMVEELSSIEFTHDAATGQVSWSRILEITDALTELTTKMVTSGYDFAVSPAGSILMDMALTYLGPLP